MKTLIPALFCLLMASTGLAQHDKTPPDFKKMEQVIADQQSPYYYPVLLKRYKDNDTSLTDNEYYYLYYGFSFQNSYSPYGRSPLEEDIKKASEKDDTDKMIELEKKLLNQFPFNLRDLYALEQLYKRKGDTVNAAIYESKLINVGRAIYSTGDGQTDTTAMYVISVDHEYDLIELFGFEFGGTQALIQKAGHSMDKMQLKKNQEGIEYLYFNVDRLFAAFLKPGKKN